MRALSGFVLGVERVEFGEGWVPVEGKELSH